jgi:hypothetical protein
MRSYPKNPRQENPHLLLMARNEQRPCLIQAPGLCVSRGAAVWCCACHGNSSLFNKGGQFKAHDFFTVWGCARCHGWMDASYTASGYERQQAFLRALAHQVRCYAEMIEFGAESKKNRAAARWALDGLIAEGYAVADPDHIAAPSRLLLDMTP